MDDAFRQSPGRFVNCGMPRNVYWELYYHLVWRTKDNMSLLTEKVEPLTHKYLIHRALQTPDAIVHAVGGIEDHIHMAVSLPPTVELAKWVGDIKGACSHEINHGTRSIMDRVARARWRGRRDMALCRSASATCRGWSTTSAGNGNTTPRAEMRIGWSGLRTWKLTCLKAGDTGSPWKRAAGMKTGGWIGCALRTTPEGVAYERASPLKRAVQTGCRRS
jgi:REP element-mobilizing transposase RayT